MTNKLKIQNFISWVIWGNIPSSWDFSVTLSQSPAYTKWFITLEPTTNNREVVYFDNRIWNTIYVKAVNRPTPKAHSLGTNFEMTNVAEMFNYLSDNTNTFGYIEKIGWLVINVWGGNIKTTTSRISVSNTELTLPAWQTNYIYLDTNSNTIKQTLVLSTADAGILLATVVSGASSVASVVQEQPFSIPWTGWSGWSSTWGGIDWTLSDQTDLQSALNTKANDSAVVKLTWDQAIAGIKIFTSSPVAPPPTASWHVATKAYVDAHWGGGGGGHSWVNWWSIWGVLSDQTDLVSALNLKANQSTTYTKSEVDSALSTKANQSTTYTISEVDSSLASKANDSEVVKLTWNQTIAWTKTLSSIKYTDWNQAVWKVLTSDASGNATWETPTTTTFVWASVWITTWYSITTTATVIDFNSESFDTDTFHSNSTNPSRLVCVNSWYYQINFTGSFALDSDCRISIRKNWTTTILTITEWIEFWTTKDKTISCSIVTSAETNDYFEILLQRIWWSSCFVYSPNTICTIHKIW